MQVNQTGIFYVNAGEKGPIKQFPREFSRRLSRSFEPRFLLLLAACALVFGSVTFLLSLREISDTPTEKEILKIQERYAQLVMNQPKPEVVEEPVEKETITQEEGADQEEQEEEVVDRENESFVEKQERRAATEMDRRAKREQVSKQIQSTGIFAAITSSGGSGGGSTSPVSDLLGATDVMAGLDNIDVGKGSFATNNASAEQIQARKGSRKSGVGIEKQSIGKAAGQKIASTGGVTVSSQEATVKSGSSSSTSKACLNRIISRQGSRLKRVYENWLKRQKDLSGRIKVKFTVLPSGSVANVKIIQSSMNSEDFEKTILRYIGQWRFSTCTISSPIELEVPFVFEGSS